MAKLLVKEICESKGMKMKDLAALMGISPSALSQSLSSTPSFGTLERIAKALNVSIGDLCEKQEGIIGFIEVPNGIHKIKGKDDYVKISKEIPGLPQIPHYSVETAKEMIRGYVNACMKGKGKRGVMGILGSDELFCITYLEEAFILTIRYGHNQGFTAQYDIEEFHNGDGSYSVEGDDGIIKSITNDLMKVYEDEDYGEELQ